MDYKVWLLRTDFDAETTVVNGDGCDVMNEVMTWADYAMEEVSYDADHFFAKGHDKDLEDSGVHSEVEFNAERVDMRHGVGYMISQVIMKMPWNQREALAKMLEQRDSTASSAIYRYVVADEPIVGE